MGMPDDLVLVRHGESTGNRARAAAQAGDLSAFTEEYITTPGHQWSLTEAGTGQAAAIGSWLREQALGFDAWYCSPYLRTRHTAGHLGLRDARWRLNRALRERDWGDIGTIPLQRFLEHSAYTLNAVAYAHDPLYWCPPNGESLAHVAEDRVRNVLDTLHRQHDTGRVLAVTHGELMVAFQIVLERLDDAQAATLIRDRDARPGPATAVHYTRRDPDTGRRETHLAWRRTARPQQQPAGDWQVAASEFVPIRFRELSNADLLSD